MKKTLLVILVAVFVWSSCGRVTRDELKFNFDFEKLEEGFPMGWKNSDNPNYLVYVDSITTKKGNYSIVIEHKEGNTENYKSVSFTLPENYPGKQIKISGYIKTENVTDGYAGLWMRIDPYIAYDNMQSRGVTGTTDWKKYEITFPLDPSETKQIIIGGEITGKGKMWLDDLNVTIDGKEIYKLSPYSDDYFPAKKDHQFDKGSSITFPSLDEQLISNLELLGKVWGFLKYHHPEIGKGKYNWDYELFRFLPRYLEIHTIEERDKVLLAWIKKYGKISRCKDCKEAPEDAFLKPDLSWMEDTDMTSGLKKKINEIYVNRHQGVHYYIRMFPHIGNPAFKNEDSYAEMQYPDEGFRLLSLYRYWNMIQYFFPNTYMTDKNWNTVLKEYIPKFMLAKDKLEYELAALQIIGEINDTHANLWSGRDQIDELRGKMYAPFRVEFIEEKLVVTDYYNPEYKEESGLAIGDIITHIHGKTVEHIIDSLKTYYPASNRSAMLRDMSRDLVRSNSATINIEYLSSGQKSQKELTLYNSIDIYKYYRNKNEKSYKFINDSIGYITLATIQNEDIPQIKEAFKNTKGMVIDIRNYPSTFVVFSLGSYFVNHSTPFVKFTKGNVNNPGEFSFTRVLKMPKGEETYQGKLVVLVNAATQSQAEYTAMAFRAGMNTTIIGSQTAGADGNVSDIFLPGGLKTWISGIGVYYPDGTETQRVGIVPDIEIKPTIEGIKNGRDELLEKAIEIINNK